MSVRPHRTNRPLPTLLMRSIAAGVTAALALTLLAAYDAPSPRIEEPGTDLRSVAAEPNPVTPGNFRGYGFDQCLAPTQKAMDTWLYHSPFLAVGIYISGNSRGCRDQPNLTPTWIRTQLRKGWRLLPITLGPQASCHPDFPRYDDDPTIISRPGKKGNYGRARKQGVAEAKKTVAAAKRLGLVARSTLWYDIEGFDVTNTRCRKSALAFLTAWTRQLHRLDYVSGVYSSAGSGIKMLDDARVAETPRTTIPDMIWIARWDGKANTSTSYIRPDGWLPGRRMKQYLGGHDETWGGVTINIDRNYLDLGKGGYAAPEKHCGGVTIDRKGYPVLAPPTATRKPDRSAVRALQCLLSERGLYDGRLRGFYNKATIAAVRAWRADRGWDPSPNWVRRAWVAILAEGAPTALKVGSTGADVRRVQRALNAADTSLQRAVTGVYDSSTRSAVRAYQRRMDVKDTGIVNRPTWRKLRNGGF